MVAKRGTDYILSKKLFFYNFAVFGMNALVLCLNFCNPKTPYLFSRHNNDCREGFLSKIFVLKADRGVWSAGFCWPTRVSQFRRQGFPKWSWNLLFWNKISWFRTSAHYGILEIMIVKNKKYVWKHARDNLRGKITKVYIQRFTINTINIFFYTIQILL